MIAKIKCLLIVRVLSILCTQKSSIILLFCYDIIILNFSKLWKTKRARQFANGPSIAYLHVSIFAFLLFTICNSVNSTNSWVTHRNWCECYVESWILHRKLLLPWVVVDGRSTLLGEKILYLTNQSTSSYGIITRPQMLVALHLLGKHYWRESFLLLESVCRN